MVKYTRKKVLQMVSEGKSLQGTDFSQMNLSGADLSGADLSSAELLTVDLKGANLRKANLSSAKLFDSKLSSADFTDANLSKVEMYDSNLKGANFSGANLRGANLRGAKLSEAILSTTNLTDANLRGACLREVNLRGANLEKANLREADLREAYLGEVNLRGAFFYNANLLGASLNRADLVGSNLTAADLSHTDLSSANLSECTLNGADLRGANLTEANLTKADLYGANLGQANLTAAVLRDAELVSADLEGATLNNADMSGANIYHMKTPGWKIENIKCTHIYYYYPFTADKEDREKNRKESRREFNEGEFEAIYKSMPTIELWFKDKFSFTDELRLMDIQDRLQREVPNATISLKKKEWVGNDMIITLTVREEDKVKYAAKAVERLYGDKVLEDEFLRRMNEEKVQNILLSIPAIAKALTYGTEAEEKTGMTMFVNSPINITIQTGEGHTSVLADSVTETAIGPGATLNIFQKHEDHQPAIDRLLKELRTGLGEDRKALVDQFTEALNTKDEDKVRSVWEKITSVTGTIANGAAIAHGLKTLLGL